MPVLVFVQPTIHALEHYNLIALRSHWLTCECSLSVYCQIPVRAGGVGGQCRQGADRRVPLCAR